MGYSMGYPGWVSSLGLSLTSLTFSFYNWQQFQLLLLLLILLLSPCPCLVDKLSVKSAPAPPSGYCHPTTWKSMSMCGEITVRVTLERKDRSCWYMIDKENEREREGGRVGQGRSTWKVTQEGCLCRWRFLLRHIMWQLPNNFQLRAQSR